MFSGIDLQISYIEARLTELVTGGGGLLIFMMGVVLALALLEKVARMIRGAVPGRPRELLADPRSGLTGPEEDEVMDEVKRADEARSAELDEGQSGALDLGREFWQEVKG